MRSGETGNFADPADVGCLLSVAGRQLLVQFDVSLVIVGIVEGLWPMYPLNLTEMVKIELVFEPEVSSVSDSYLFRFLPACPPVNVDPAALDQFVSEENYLCKI